MLEDIVTKVDESELQQPLKATLAAFLDDFRELIEMPSCIRRYSMIAMLSNLVDEIMSAETPSVLWWEVTLYLAEIWAKNCGDSGAITLERIDALHLLLNEHLPNDDSTVTLEEITNETVFGIILMSETLTEPKKNFVAPNAISLSQAHFSEQAWFRAIYAGRKPVGFVMLEIDEETPHYYIWRFMIAESYHGRGYGRKAMEAIKAHVRTLPNATELYLSYGQGEGSPEGFYKKLGFEETGEVDDDEIVAKIGL